LFHAVELAYEPQLVLVKFLGVRSHVWGALHHLVQIHAGVNRSLMGTESSLLWVNIFLLTPRRHLAAPRRHIAAPGRHITLRGLWDRSCSMSWSISVRKPGRGIAGLEEFVALESPSRLGVERIILLKAIPEASKNVEFHNCRFRTGSRLPLLNRFLIELLKLVLVGEISEPAVAQSLLHVHALSLVKGKQFPKKILGISGYS
jgi:hypothetical protein